MLNGTLRVVYIYSNNVQLKSDVANVSNLIQSDELSYIITCDQLRSIKSQVRH